MGKIPRIYLPKDAFTTEKVTLTKDAQHYLRKVLRLRKGDEFCALDGVKTAWRCTLDDGETGLRVDNFPAVPPHHLKLTVGLALCKGARFEQALESLAELGVERVVPLLTERSERKSPSTQKFHRWQTICESASSLAYRLSPLRLEQPQKLTDFEVVSELVICHPGGKDAVTVLGKHRDSLTLLIGPEGGFSATETEFLDERATQMDLGATNLRVATAATVAAGLALNLAPAEE